MAVAKKHKRKLVFKDREFFWYVRDEDDGGLALTVLSGDKRFAVQYALEQAAQTRHIVVMNEEFGVGHHRTGCYRRYLCPDWDRDGAVTPGVVRELIEWCQDPPTNLVEVDWLGRPVER
ncbi:MAG: hypothetical protein KC800_08965 [Candidatus Eremiobacteraeota bacterium]|nr:hypothetical protein [Candidatus Eremiobacteraeota bacterium]